MLTIILAILLAISVVAIGVLMSERGIDKRVLERISAKNVELSEENAKLKKVQSFKNALHSAVRRADARTTQLNTELREERARRRELDRGLIRASGIIEMLMERDVDDISIDRNQARRLFVV